MKDDSLYLKDIVKNPQPGPHLDLIRAAENAGRESWPIWSLFAFRPNLTSHLMQFVQGVMHEPSSLSAGHRELIAAYVSSLNHCEFCENVHRTVAIELLRDEALVDGVLTDMENSRLTEKEKLLFSFVRKLTLAQSDICEADVRILTNAAWTDEEIYYAILACSLFNFYNRWVTASGVLGVSESSYQSLGKIMAQNGYDIGKRIDAVRESQV